MEKTETHILTEIAAGNKLAFEQLFFQYQPQLVAFLTGLTHDPELSRDMAQEIFLSIWNERKKTGTDKVNFRLSLSNGPL